MVTLKISRQILAPWRMTLLFLVFFSEHANAARLPWPILDSQKHWQVDEDSAHFSVDLAQRSSKYNFDNSGARLSPASLNEISTTGGRIHVGFPVGPRWSVFGQLGYRRIEDSSLQSGVVGLFTESRGGLADAFLSFRYLFLANRLVGGRFSTADYIEPGTTRLLWEAAVQAPIHSRSRPALGEEGYDIHNLLRFGWFPWRWYSFGFSGGYVYRTGPFAGEFPLEIRNDFYLRGRAGLRLWLGLDGYFSTAASSSLPQSQFTSGSFLYGNRRTNQTWAALGIAVKPGGDWEVGAEGRSMIRGMNTAAGHQIGLSVAYRPRTESTTSFYNPKRDLNIGGLARPAGFAGYEFTAPIIQVSSRGRFAKIGYGTEDNVHIDDAFHVFEPGEELRNGERSSAFLGGARVVAVGKGFAVLEIEGQALQERIKLGMEVKKIEKEDPKGIRRLIR